MGNPGLRGLARSFGKSSGFFHSRENERGYVLTWVMVLTLVAGMIIGPFLQFMVTGVRASHSHTDTMQEFYAADSGIEDASHKVLAEYSATSTLNGDISADVDIITVTAGSTARFPVRGVIAIESERIYYAGKTDAQLTGCQRGYDGTTAKAHDDGTPVTAGMPAVGDVSDSWQYGIEDINDKQVDVTIEPIWILDGLESDANGTMPHAELVVVGQVLEIPTTALTGDIDNNDTTIPVASTAAFPDASEGNPSVIRIENELIQYIGKTEPPDPPALIAAPDGRGFDGTGADGHGDGEEVTAEEITYHVDITYDDSVGSLKIDKVGAWLPTGFSYMPGSSNITTGLDGHLYDYDNTIDVVSTELFPNSGVIAIDGEIIQYGSKTPTQFNDCTRPDAADHDDGTVVSAEPQQTGHHGGTVLAWTFNNIDFEKLPYELPLSGEGGFTPSAEFPFRRTVTFNLSPIGEPRGIFSWTSTNRDDIDLSWDTSSGIFKITSTATRPIQWYSYHADVLRRHKPTKSGGL